MCSYRVTSIVCRAKSGGAPRECAIPAPEVVLGLAHIPSDGAYALESRELATDASTLRAHRAEHFETPVQVPAPGVCKSDGVTGCRRAVWVVAHKSFRLGESRGAQKRRVHKYRRLGSAGAHPRRINSPTFGASAVYLARQWFSKSGNPAYTHEGRWNSSKVGRGDAGRMSRA